MNLPVSHAAAVASAGNVKEAGKLKLGARGNNLATLMPSRPKF
jgi:hypothetical protein